jgi:hypothetical protein
VKRKKKLSKKYYGTSHVLSKDEAKFVFEEVARLRNPVASIGSIHSLAHGCSTNWRQARRSRSAATLAVLELAANSHGRPLPPTTGRSVWSMASPSMVTLDSVPCRRIFRKAPADPDLNGTTSSMDR